MEIEKLLKYYEIKFIYNENFIKIETENANIITNNCDVSIKKEDNGKPVIIFESKQK